MATLQTLLGLAPVHSPTTYDMLYESERPRSWNSFKDVGNRADPCPDPTGSGLRSQPDRHYVCISFITHTHEEGREMEAPS